MVLIEIFSKMLPLRKTFQGSVFLLFVLFFILTDLRLPLFIAKEEAGIIFSKENADKEETHEPNDVDATREEKDIFDELLFHDDDAPAVNSSLTWKTTEKVFQTIDRESSLQTVRWDELKSRIHFVPFPHRNISFGADAQCNWTTFDLSNEAIHDDATSSAVIRSLLGATTISAMDATQRAALQQGICMTASMSNVSSPKTSRIHLFSSKEARYCLENITLVVAGDSYNKQLFVGLYDVLVGSSRNDEITNSKKRTKVVDSATKHLARLRKENNITTMIPIPELYYKCEDSCYGMTVPFSQLCSECIQGLKKKKKGYKKMKNKQKYSSYNNDTNHNNKPAHRRLIVPVVGAGVHIRKSHGGGVTTTIREMLQFPNAVRGGVIFNSMPSYQLDKVPQEYKQSTQLREQIYHKLLPMVNKQPNMRFLDFFQLTDTCVWNNCSTDGGHRSRFVNRWKAQLVLNTLCEYDSSN